MKILGISIISNYGYSYSLFTEIPIYWSRVITWPDVDSYLFNEKEGMVGRENYVQDAALSE